MKLLEKTMNGLFWLIRREYSGVCCGFGKYSVSIKKKKTTSSFYLGSGIISFYWVTMSRLLTAPHYWQMCIHFSSLLTQQLHPAMVFIRSLWIRFNTQKFAENYPKKERQKGRKEEREEREKTSKEGRREREKDKKRMRKGRFSKSIFSFADLRGIQTIH